MSFVQTLQSLSIPPDAPRIGTAGSPLDPPQSTVPPPREGLGLGGIDMPEGMKGLNEGYQEETSSKDRRFDTRYLAFRPTRPTRGHAASSSSPPSLLPFVKSLSSQGPPTASSQPRKFSLQPSSQLHSLSNNPRKMSEGAISYPIVSRIDSLPTFTPDEERRPAPSPLKSSNQQPRILVDDEQERTPTPQSQRTASTTTTKTPRSPPLKPVVPSSTSTPPRRLSSSGRDRTPKPAVVRPISGERQRRDSAGSGALAAVRFKGLRISDTTYSGSSSHFDSSDAEDSPIIDDQASFPHHSTTVVPAPRLQHRRAISEESPRIVQAMTFNRTRSAEEIPLDLQAVTAAASASSKKVDRSATVWATASPALIPISEVKAKAKARAAMVSPTKSDSVVPVRPPSASRLTEAPRPSSAGSSNTIGISVKGLGSKATTKDFGKATLGKDGVTVCLRSYSKPEDMEVAWTCVPGVDEEGKPYTQWEMKFRPRSSLASGGPISEPALAHPPLAANSHFLNYRINASTAGPTQPVPSRSHSTTSPLSETIDPLVAANAERRRKSSSSTSRSDSFSQGTSFSSESSYGPPTPPRRRKSSSISHALSSYDFDSKPPPLPSSATSSYFDIPLPNPPTTVAVDDREAKLSPNRANRASSYTVGSSQRTRQFSIDPSVSIPRSASVPEVGLAISAPVKSPRDHRFARCLPPTSEAQVDLASWSDSSEAPRTSDLPLSNSFLASRSGRKHSIAPPHPLLIPKTTIDERPPTSASSLTNPQFTPSPLGRSNVTYSIDEARTPTRASHAKLTTTPSPPPPPTYHITLPPPLTSSKASSSVSTTTDSDASLYGSLALRDIVEESHTRSSSSRNESTIESEEDLDDAAHEAFGSRMARSRQGKRMMSRWSDTETEDDEIEDPTAAAGLTSWGKLPDVSTTDEERV